MTRKSQTAEVQARIESAFVSEVAKGLMEKHGITFNEAIDRIREENPQYLEKLEGKRFEAFEAKRRGKLQQARQRREG